MSAKGRIIRWPLKHAKVVLGVCLDKEGVGVDGEAPSVALRRVSDGFYLDFDDNSFKAAGWVTRQQTLTNLVTSPVAGLYQYLWDASLAVRAVALVIAEYELVAGSEGDFVGEELMSFERVMNTDEMRRHRQHVADGTAVGHDADFVART